MATQWLHGNFCRFALLQISHQTIDYWCLRPDSNPYTLREVADFKSAASTDFATRAAHRLCEGLAMHQGSPREPCAKNIRWVCWRRDPESNRARRICNPLHNRFAIAPGSALRPLFSAKKKGSRGFPVFLIWSGIRGSNSRPIPWQGIALPTELIPHVFHATRREPDRVPIQSRRISDSTPPSTTAASGCGYQ